MNDAVCTEMNSVKTRREVNRITKASHIIITTTEKKSMHHNGSLNSPLGSGQKKVPIAWDF